jgi:hypothetical protein
MAIQRYHGSAARTLAYRALQPFARLARNLRKSRRYAKDLPPGAGELLIEVEALAAAEDWNGALAKARAAAEIVERAGGDQAKRHVGGKLVRLGDCGRGLRLLAERLDSSKCAAREWNGESLSGGRLFIRQLHTSNMGAPIRMARFIAEVAPNAGHSVVLVEARLAPLFQRTFPQSEVRPLTSKAIPDATPEDFVTSFEGLTGFCVTDWGSIASRPFVPMLADEAATAQLRQRYRAYGKGPIVGISWGSKNARKETPDFDSWSWLVGSVPATFISLQYGPVASALEILGSAGKGNLFHDPSVDQLVDMDRFAAQIGALDAVITIDNTSAHLVGAMDKPAVLIVDDQFERAFPATGTESRWFPRMVMVRKRRREWRDAMEEARSRLEEKLAALG